MLPQPQDLKYFLELYQTKNLSRASERLGITQPSLSLALKRLEDLLKTKLFIRSNTGAVPTQAANILVKDVQSLIDQWDRMGKSASESFDRIKGLFKIGIHTSVANYAIHPWLKSLLLTYPELELHFEHDLSRNILEEVISHKVDLGLVINPKRHPDLIIQPLLKDHVTLRMSKSAKRLHDVLIYNPDLLQSQELIKQLKKKKISFNRYITTSSLELINQLTICGAGIGILPMLVASSELQEFNKLIKPVEDELCLVYRMDRPRTKAFQVLLNSISSLKI